jgi:cytochrome c oxidase subunit 2
MVVYQTFMHTPQFLTNLAARFGRFVPALLLLILTLGLFSGVAYAQEIGELARSRAAEAGEIKHTISKEDISSLIFWLKVFGILLFLGVLILVHRIAKLVDFDPFRNLSANAVQPRLFVLVNLVLAILMVWHFIEHSKYLLGESASEHGVEIDKLFDLTVLITGTMFIIVNILLVYFTFKYRSRPGHTAIHYSHNDKLEVVWTLIPAIGMAMLIIPGLQYWDHISYPEDAPNRFEMEVVAEQFQWTARYPGKDGKLGKSDYRQISGENAVGIDVNDPAGKDDILTREIHIPVGYQCKFNLRAKDVLHGFYLPHFRVNMYAVPGMPTQFTFVPRWTTEQARKEYNDPEFNYVVACSQICGGSHYKMKMNVVVHSKEDFDKWLAEQKPYFDADAPAEEGAATEAAPQAEANQNTQKGMLVVR